MEIPSKFVDKAKFIRVIFTDVENEYDALLHMMTFRLDSVWRKRMLSKINFSHESRILDLACGTGLVTFELVRLVRKGSVIVGLDLSPAMLSVARRKRARVGSDCSIEFVRAVGEYLPFRDSLFTSITVGLALRNFANKLAVFKDALRILAPSGWFLSVDFIRPENSIVWTIYRYHIFHVLPTIGRLVSVHWKRTLIYLANSILISTPASEICTVLEGLGFQKTFSEKMSLGIVALICAQR
jgi:demethylmenaquinone methyltransferase/2-methoxy-6-polyprenyl-1,4-benzoquinol methylase